MALNTCTISVYLESRSSLNARILAINDLIAAMELKLVDYMAGSGSTVQDYQMNDGQMIVRTTYRSLSEIQAGIKGLEILKNRYVNKMNGRDFVLRDASKF